jgi:predicted lipid-binding transport protein (Tim44 family)
MAKMMDENPLLIMSFVAQQINCVRDATGAITEGGEDHIERVFYVFAMRRNQAELDPLLAWQVMEIGVQASMETW